GSSCLRAASFDQRGPAQRLVSGAAIGEADQLDDLAEGAPLRRGAAHLDVGVVRMGVEDTDSHRLRGRFHDGLQGSRTVNDSKPPPYSCVVLIFSTSLPRFKGFLDNRCGWPTSTCSTASVQESRYLLAARDSEHRINGDQGTRRRSLLGEHELPRRLAHAS